MKLKAKSALVTGAGGGIGAAIAHKLAEEGARVAVVDLKLTSAEEVAQSICASGGEAFAIDADVANDIQVAAMVARTVEAFGGLDILVNNAGIVHPKDNALENTTEEAWDMTMTVNLKSIFLASRHALAPLEDGGGAIVNIASIVGLMGSFPSQIAYTASKGGVIALTRELGVALARRGIRVNAVAPGVTATPMGAQIVQDDEAWQLRRLHIPLGRLAQPEEIAAATAFLASDEAKYMTAQCISVDGGMTGAYLTPPD